MTCNEYERSISSLIDGEAAESTSAGLFAHLASCSSCRAFFHQVQRLNRSLGRLPDLPADAAAFPAEPGAAGMSRLSLWHRQVSLRYPVVALAAAVICALLLLTAEWNRHSEPMYVTTLPTVVVADERSTN